LICLNKCLDEYIGSSVPTQINEVKTMRKYLYLTFIIISSVMVTIYVLTKSSLPAITYFPIDEQMKFDFVQTNLKVTPKNQKQQLIWTSYSKSEQPLYLRQDVSLLYEDGLFKGVQSKWIEDQATILLEKDMPAQDQRLYQSISYHYGEIHQPNKKINSIGEMSSSELFSKHANHQSKAEKVNQKLTSHWNTLMEQFELNPNSYVAIPLTKLYMYNDKSLPTLSQGKTDEVIGQLWEGLYKNYMIPISQSLDTDETHHIPLILFHKDGSHLMVIYTINGEKKKLIQQISHAPNEK